MFTALVVSHMRHSLYSIRCMYCNYVMQHSKELVHTSDLGSSGSGMWVCGLDGVGSGWGQVAGGCECGNKPSGSIKRGEFLD
jgi:hypothetical protein